MVSGFDGYAQTMTVRAVVHIGPIKTGSTALALYFSRASSRNLLSTDVIYPMGELWFGRTAQGAIRQCPEIARLKRNADGSQDFETPGVVDAIAKVAAELRARPGSTDKVAVFIAETVTHDHPVPLIQEAFTDHFDEVTFVMVARRQDKAAASTLAQEVKTPHLYRINLDPRKRQWVHDLPFGDFNHLRNYERWLSGPENYRLVAIPYLEGEQASFASIERFHRAGDIPGPVEIPGIKGRRIHPTFSREGLNALIKIKKRRSRWGWLPGINARTDAQIQSTTATYLASADESGIEPSGRRFVPFSLTDDEASWLLSEHADGNRELVSRLQNGPFASDWRAWERALEI
jgi:hypothetical protein